MEQNKKMKNKKNIKKISKGFEAYTILSYFLCEVGLLMALGMYLGHHFWPNTQMKGILGAVGGIMGVISFMLTVLKMSKDEEQANRK